MKLKIKCFGGKLGFIHRKTFPKLCGDEYLYLSRKNDNKLIKKYINKEDNYYIPLIKSLNIINNKVVRK